MPALSGSILTAYCRSLMFSAGSELGSVAVPGARVSDFGLVAVPGTRVSDFGLVTIPGTGVPELSLY